MSKKLTIGLFGYGVVGTGLYDVLHKSKTDEEEKLEQYRAASYQRHQGEKLRKRFSKESYFMLSKAMDSHHLGRGRNSVENALNQITA